MILNYCEIGFFESLLGMSPVNLRSISTCNLEPLLANALCKSPDCSPSARSDRISWCLDPSKTELGTHAHVFQPICDRLRSRKCWQAFAPTPARRKTQGSTPTVLKFRSRSVWSMLCLCRGAAVSRAAKEGPIRALGLVPGNLERGAES